MMNNQTRTITGPIGHFSLQENGIIYFQKADSFIIDENAATAILESVFALDSSGAAKVMVIQGHGIEYNFEAMQALLTSRAIEKVAFVVQTKTQLLTTSLLKQLSKTLKAQFSIELFSTIVDAEAWLLEEPEYMVVH